ncbi:endonuclease/exonuclease/phosphatase family protein [Kaistella palustris]|uniref:endonuclease/exonuclease/phosphatase family protein n=1 Tax=Kaistella palustris TaxID=493376 RepID=UPI00040D85C1|nr:endonuclease/exonuclease/phosphatase family protein [Kaistella palustris]
MWEIYLGAVAFLTVLTLLPKIPSSYWIFRVADFGKIQINFLAVLTFLSGFFLFKNEFWWYTQIVLALIIVFHSITLIKYTRYYPVKKFAHSPESSSKNIKIISANIYQFNEDYGRFIALIRKCSPDIVLTMESNSAWEKALAALEKEYPFQHKVPLENTYGMHFYSKLKIEKAQTHFFVAPDIPSIEIDLKTTDGYRFVFFGIHPPPPSPTEEKTSKERDGDLLSVAKRVKQIHKPVLVTGDFNNVAWSKSSRLFRKVSHLIDPRVGKAFVSTFHAKYRLFRFPIDLMFHSEDVFIVELKTLENFGSDHLPVYCEFFIDLKNTQQTELIETADTEEIAEAEEMIAAGIEEVGERPAVAVES